MRIGTGGLRKLASTVHLSSGSKADASAWAPGFDLSSTPRAYVSAKGSASLSVLTESTSNS